MKWLLSFVSAVLFSLMLTGGVRAREEIRNYQVDIEVRTDASIEVTETITVNAEGNDIRRGIYRDIPLRALDDWGLWSSNGIRPSWRCCTTVNRRPTIPSGRAVSSAS
jgi:hypothetical protein